MYCTYIYVNGLKRICEMFCFPEDWRGLAVANLQLATLQFAIFISSVYSLLYSNISLRIHFDMATSCHTYNSQHLQFAVYNELFYSTMCYITNRQTAKIRYTLPLPFFRNQILKSIKKGPVLNTIRTKILHTVH